jgi:hypothetical protein
MAGVPAYQAARREPGNMTPPLQANPKDPARPQGMKNLQFTPKIPQFG